MNNDDLTILAIANKNNNETALANIINNNTVFALSKQFSGGGGGGSGSGLPNVSKSDNGKVLRVVNGAWNKSLITELPSVSGIDNGKILSVVNGNWDKANIEDLLGIVKLDCTVEYNDIGSIKTNYTLNIPSGKSYSIGSANEINITVHDTTIANNNLITTIPMLLKSNTYKERWSDTSSYDYVLIGKYDMRATEPTYGVGGECYYHYGDIYIFVDNNTTINSNNYILKIVGSIKYVQYTDVPR